MLLRGFKVSVGTLVDVEVDVDVESASLCIGHPGGGDPADDVEGWLGGREEELLLLAGVEAVLPMLRVSRALLLLMPLMYRNDGCVRSQLECK